MSDPGMRIAINTGGGDAPGLNAVIEAAAHAAHVRGWELIGIREGSVRTFSMQCAAMGSRRSSTASS